MDKNLIHVVHSSDLAGRRRSNKFQFQQNCPGGGRFIHTFAVFFIFFKRDGGREYHRL